MEDQEARETQEIDKLVAQVQSNLEDLSERRPMEKPVKNFYTIKPFQLGPGDVLLCTVKLLVLHEKGKTGRHRYRLYRCAYPADTDCMYQEDVPQGSRIYPEDMEAFAEELFPVVGSAGMEGD